jgi:hypothetical protein
VEIEAEGEQRQSAGPPCDTELARTASPAHVLQLAVYASLLARA